MKVWVTRNKSNVAMPILMYEGDKPTWERGFWSMGIVSDLTEMHTPRSFKERYGFAPAKGSCKQYEFNLTEIE